MKSILACSLLALLASRASADVVTLTAVADGTLWNDPAGATANGSGPVMIVGRAGSTSSAPLRRGLLRFDVASALPAGSTVHSAQLVLAFTSGNTGARNLEVHRVLASWGEGASSTASGQGAPAQAGDATWLHRFYSSTSWSSAGGDFDPVVSSVLAVDQFGVHNWPSTATAVADVQSWLDLPSSNHGWLLKLDNESVAQTTKVFGTREATAPAERPQLVIDFTPPPVSSYCSAQPTPAGCAPLIGWSGTPSASSTASFTIELSNTANQRPALLSYGTSARAALPYLGGTLCVAPPTRRIALASTQGTLGSDDCSGTRSFDFNAYAASAADPALVSGATVFVQWLARDPSNASGSFASSAALELHLGP